VHDVCRHVPKALTSLTAAVVEFMAQVFWHVVLVPQVCRQLMSDTHAASPEQV